MVAKHSVYCSNISWKVYLKIRRENAGMSNDKQWKKTLSPKAQGFLSKDKPLTSKTASKKKAKAVFDEYLIDYKCEIKFK